MELSPAVRRLLPVIEEPHWSFGDTMAHVTHLVEGGCPKEPKTLERS